MGRASMAARGVLPGILQELSDVGNVIFIIVSKVRGITKDFSYYWNDEKESLEELININFKKNFLNQFRIFHRIIYFETRLNIFRQVVPLLTLFLSLNYRQVTILGKRIIFKKKCR